jgi:polyadenylate-binding protein
MQPATNPVAPMASPSPQMSAPTGAAPGTPGYPQQSASLYVGDLVAGCTEAKLFEVFNAIGPVSSIRICRDSITRRSLGYAYVNFNSYTDAERALDTMNYMPIMGKACRIMWSQRDPAMRKSGAGNIFVKNLAKDIDHKALFDTFSLFGNILSCKVAVDRATGESRGYGFVQFETVEAAEEAIKKVNGMTIEGQVVYVGAFKKREARGSTNSWTNVFVKNLSQETDEEAFRAMFTEFGEITSLKLEVDEEGKSKGFGFVNYSTHEEAEKCVEAMNNKKVGVYTEGEQKDEDRLIFVGPAMKKAAREKVIHDKFIKLKRERMQQFQGLNLYVKNLDDSVDDERLKQEFSQFGTITSARIMRDDSGASRGFGFICFSQGDEATKAVTDMSGKMLAGKPIYVALAQRKEVRQAQLNAAHAARTGMARGPMGMSPMMFMPGMMGGARPMMMQPGMQQGMPGMPGGNYPRPMMGMPGMPGMPGMMPSQQRMMMNGNGRGRNNRGPKQGGNKQFYNNQQRPNGPMPGQPMMMPAQQMPPAQQVRQMAAPAPLTAQALASAPPAKQKNMIGERLYPLIQAQQPQRAGKITGMLLEMDNGELLNLLESPDALKAKVNEAVQVLEQHSNRN